MSNSHRGDTLLAGNRLTDTLVRPLRGLGRLAGSARAWALFIVGLIVLLIVYYALLDRFTPITSDAYVQAYVVQIAPDVEGPVVAVHVRDNQSVSAGAPLFDIDPRPFAYRVNQLQARLAIVVKQVTELERTLEAAIALIEQREADLLYARQRFQQVSVLKREGYAPDRQLEEMTDNLRVRQSLVEQARSERRKAEAALAAIIDGEHASIKEVKAELAKAQYDLERTKVFAPVDGFVTNLQLTTGSYARVGVPVLTLIDSDTWWVVANFRENSVNRMRSGQHAELALTLHPGRILDGTVESVGWGVSQGQGVPSGILPEVEAPQNWVSFAQRFPVRVTLSDTVNPPHLRVGASATVVVYTENRPVLNALAALWLRIASVQDFLY